MDRGPHVGKKLRQTSISFQKVGLAIKTESKSDEEENENDCETNNEDQIGSFLCEFCDSNSSMAQCFKSKAELVSHCLRYHPTACVGCFEIFSSSEDLHEHKKVSPHEPPVCRVCCRSFASEVRKSDHRCRKSRTPGKNAIKEPCEEIKTEYENEASFSDAKKKAHDNESEKGFSCGEGDEDDIEEKHVPGETSEESDFSDDDGDLEEDERFTYKPTSTFSLTRDVTLECLHCSFEVKGTEREPSLKRLRKHTVARHPMVCCFCFEGFENADTLVEHQKSMNHMYWICNACDTRIMFIKRSSYYNHLHKHHPDQCDISCPKCPARFISKQSLTKHLRHYHEHQVTLRDKYGVFGDMNKTIPNNICTICDYSTQSTYAIMMHMYEKHPGPNQIPKFKCEKCQIGYSRPQLFSRHILRNHFDDEELLKAFRDLYYQYNLSFECEPCRKTFVLRQKFAKHLRVIHRSSLPFHCSICSAGFLDSTDLRVHECFDHKNTTPYICDECNKPFKDLTKLLTHVYKVHKLTTMPYIYCYIHNVGFCSNDIASHHFEHQHRNQNIPKRQLEKFECKECGKFLLGKNNFERHTAMHRPDRPYECKFCDKKFPLETLLKLHEKQHSTDNKCEICGKTFHTLLNLKRHAVVHTGEKPFECSICGLRVSQDSALRRHLAKVHPGGILGKPRSTKPRKCRTLVKAQKDEEKACEATEPVVQIDAKLLKTDLKRKPKAVLPKKSRARKRRQPTSSEESEDEDESEAPPVTPSRKLPRKAKADAEGTKAKKRKRKSNQWSHYMESSSDDEDNSCSESDVDDMFYIP